MTASNNASKKNQPVKRKTKAKKTTKRTKSSPANILPVLKGLRACGNTSPKRQLVALLSGYEFTKSFSNLLGKLKKREHIEYPNSGEVCLTAAGMTEAGAAPPITTETVHDRIRDLLTPKETQIFDHISDGQVHDREEVKAAVGCSHLIPKSFGNLLSSLRSLGVLDYLQDGKIQLNDTMAFPFGRPVVSGARKPHTPIVTVEAGDTDRNNVIAV